MKEKFKMDKHDLVLLYFDENDNYWGTDIHIFTMFYYIDIKVSPYPGYTGSSCRRYWRYLPAGSQQTEILQRLGLGLAAEAQDILTEARL